MERARTDQAKQDRRLSLLDAAVAEFFEKGFAAARMDDIATRAGVSKGTLYLYFKSKDDMFAGLIEAFALPNLAQAEQAVRDAPSAEEALRRLVRFMPHILRNTPMPKMAKVLIGDAGRFPEAVHAYRRKVFDRIVATITGILERGKKAGEFHITEPSLTARLTMAPVLMSAIWSTVFEPIDDEEPVDLDALFALHERFLISALKQGAGA